MAEATEYHLHEGRGTNGENCWLVFLDDGSEITAYIDPAVGIEASLADILDPPVLPPGPVIIPYGIFRARWEPAELEALFEAKKTDWRIEDYVTLASAQGHINLSGATAAAAKALFVQLGVLSEERADVIFN